MLYRHWTKQYQTSKWSQHLQRRHRNPCSMAHHYRNQKANGNISWLLALTPRSAVGIEEIQFVLHGCLKVRKGERWRKRRELSFGSSSAIARHLAVYLIEQSMQKTGSMGTS
uniref:Uncharacterized protein n=1 Tax=Arundo donax TaxID=35708 RepID=A0A0A9G6Q7_ARUDO